MSMLSRSPEEAVQNFSSLKLTATTKKIKGRWKRREEKEKEKKKRKRGGGREKGRRKDNKQKAACLKYSACRSSTFRFNTKKTNFKSRHLNKYTDKSCRGPY